MTKDLLHVAEDFLRGFDIPSHRCDINRNNLQWLLKNLKKKNADNRRYEEVMGLLHKIDSERLYYN